MWLVNTPPQVAVSAGEVRQRDRPATRLGLDRLHLQLPISNRSPGYGDPVDQRHGDLQHHNSDATLTLTQAQRLVLEYSFDGGTTWAA